LTLPNKKILNTLTSNQISVQSVQV